MRLGEPGPLAKLFGWWIAIAACYLALVALHDLRGSPRRSIIILLGAGFVYALACLWLHRRWAGLSAATARSVVIAIVLGAIAFRVILLAVPPSLSDDVYRYRWDGRVQAAGMNPYTEPPASSELAALRDPLWLRINYHAIRTIYGPLAQWLFRVTYQLDPRLIGFQAMATLGDLLCIGLLLACLWRWGLPQWRVALYAWSPLAAIESASNAHFDSWPTAALMVAVLTGLGGKALLSTLALSAGVLFKTWPLVWLPLTLARRPPWHIGVAAAVVAGGYLWFADAGFGLLQPWLDYTSRWLFNDAGFFVLRSVTGSQPLAKGIVAAVGVGAIYTFWRRGTDPLRANYWLLLLAIFLIADDPSVVSAVAATASPRRRSISVGSRSPCWRHCPTGFWSTPAPTAPPGWSRAGYASRSGFLRSRCGHGKRESPAWPPHLARNPHQRPPRLPAARISRRRDSQTTACHNRRARTS